METDVLRWFQQVADGVTVTEVSELERTTQSGISRALARLETEVGTPLLRRSGRVLRMTHAGAVFKRHVDALLHDLDDGLAAVGQLIDPETGTVSLAFQQSFGTWLVPDLVRSFAALHPRVRFEFTQIRDVMTSAVMAETQVDLEIGTRRPDSSVRSHLIDIEPLRLALPAGHRLAHRRRVRLEEVADEAFVSLRPDSALRELCDQLCAAAGFRAHALFEGDDLSTVRGFVAGGLGVAIVPAPREGTDEATGDGVSYCDLADRGAAREIRLMWPAERRLLPAAEQFRRYVVDRSGHHEIPAVAR